MAVLLTPLLPPTRSGRTFFIASVLLGVGAFLQLTVLAWCFARGLPSRRAAVIAPGATPSLLALATPPMSLPLPTPAPATRVPLALPAASVPDPDPAATPAIDIAATDAPPVVELARPTPAPAPRLQSTPANLLEYARALRQRGDTNSALARLRDGLATEPNNPDLIAETALTYEAMQLTDKAFEQWQRIYQMGESIGALYYMADSKLHNAPGKPGASALGQTNGTGRDSNGFQDEAVLKITDLHTEDVLDDPTAEKKTVLRIVVKARPGVVIDPSKVRIETHFYDLLDGRDVVQTDAETSYKWLTAPVDWANDASEILETTYLRPRSDPTGTSPVSVLAAPAPSPQSADPVPGRGRRKHAPEIDANAAPPTSPARPRPAPRSHLFGLLRPVVLRTSVAGRAVGSYPAAPAVSTSADPAGGVGEVFSFPPCPPSKFPGPSS